MLLNTGVKQKYKNTKIQKIYNTNYEIIKIQNMYITTQIV